MVVPRSFRQKCFAHCFRLGFYRFLLSFLQVPSQFYPISVQSFFIYHSGEFLPAILHKMPPSWFREHFNIISSRFIFLLLMEKSKMGKDGLKTGWMVRSLVFSRTIWVRIWLLDNRSTLSLVLALKWLKTKGKQWDTFVMISFPCRTLVYAFQLQDKYSMTHHFNSKWRTVQLIESVLCFA